MKNLLLALQIIIAVTGIANAATYNITATTDTNGNISPPGVVTVNGSANQTFTFSPHSGYQVSSVTVDGKDQGPLWGYTFNNVTSAHTISVTFQPVYPVEPAIYIVQHVAGVWMNGNLYGAAQGSMLPAGNRQMVIDSHNNIFLTGTWGDRVTMITPQGQVWNVAGSGIKGYKDGPADIAMFNFGEGSIYDFIKMGIDSHDNIYIPDPVNNRIRLLSKHPDGLYWVSTFAGGGTTTCPNGGQSFNVSNLKLGGLIAVAVDNNDNIWASDWSGYLMKITPSGTVTCGWYPQTSGPSNPFTDKIGNLYIQMNGQDTSSYWKLPLSSFPGGSFAKISALEQNDLNTLTGAGLCSASAIGQCKIVDGPTALLSFFHSMNSLVISSDGTTLYGGNGDESVLRRVYKDGQSRSLYPDGWHQEIVSRFNGWQLGGPIGLDSQGAIYLTGDNPPKYLIIRKLVPSGR